MAGTRRTVLSLGAAGFAALLTGCATRCPPSALPGLPGDQALLSLIDGHCHLFNAKDLSAVRFISYVILEQYPQAGDRLGAGPAALADIDKPTPLDRLVQVVLAAFGAEMAPTAKAERRRLEAERAGVTFRGVPDDAKVLDGAERRLARFLAGGSIAPPSPRLTPAEQAAVDESLRSELLDAVGIDPGRGPGFRVRAREAARRLLRPDRATPPVVGAQVDFPAIFGFLGLFRRYRHCLVETLTGLQRDKPLTVGGRPARTNPQLLTPAMVDYGRWLGQDPEAGSSFLDQVEVWTEISRRAGGPAVHGYVAYCPLRRVLFKNGLLPPQSACRDDPLDAVVRPALETGGFLGVKLYPPMGFMPAGNAGRDFELFPIPDNVLKQRFGVADRSRMRELAAEIDAALDEVYELCHRVGAPIMAHGGNSVAANRCTGKFADPYFWRPVFDRGGPPGSTAPAVMLAHFGSFSYRSADPGRGLAAACDVNDQTPIDETWEYSLCRHIGERRAAGSAPPVFADVSMFTEVLKPVERGRALGKFKAMVERFDFMAEHLVYGTDWSMLAQRNGADDYAALVWRFLEDVFGERARLVLRDNFLRYAGLAPGSPAFERLAVAYRGTAAEAALRSRLEAAVRR